MISVNFNDKVFFKDLENIVNYSLGFVDGVQLGKRVMLQKLGVATIESIKYFIDSNARIDPELLHHVYEWNQTGSPDARLFDIEYTVSNLGLSFKTSFSQSMSVKQGSDTPFYDKARIMENGIPVTIRPRRREFLKFEIDGEEVFSKDAITIDNPGGTKTEGGFEKTFDSFFNNYFSQAFLKASGILDHLQNPVLYKKNLPLGKKQGKSAGIATGYRWITNIGVDV